MDADLGGTEILSPLQEVLQSERSEGLPRRVVLLTDGEVSNEDEVIGLAAGHRKDATIFCFGIGAGSSEFLVRGVARASGGAAEFVYPGETIEEKVLRHFARISAPEVDLTLGFEGLEVADTVPELLPALAPGDSATFLARVVGGTEGSAVLHGTVAGKPVRFETRIDERPGDPRADQLLPLLWARGRIRELEEGEGTMEEELIRLGTRFGLMSSATSYVAVEERAEDEKSTERAELRRIPISLTKGWGDMEGGAPGFSACPPPMAASMMDLCPSAPPPTMRARLRKASVGEVQCSMAEPAGGPTGIFFLQNADGSWDLTRELADECGATLDDLREAAATLKVSRPEKVLATLLALELADRLPPRERGPLMPMLMKARVWIEEETRGVEAPEGGFERFAGGLVG